MNKAQLIDELADRMECNRREAATAVDEVINLIMQAVSAGDKVSISGFGTFEPAQRAARDARNPRTGDVVRVEATTVPRFKPGQNFKEVVAESKAHKAKKSNAKATKA